jgi:hypothetical protein
MSFDHREETRLDKYIYYGEKILTRGLMLAMIAGLAVLFWDGWVQGSAQYQEARKTVEICNQQHGSIMDSEHLRKTCQAANITQGTLPVLFAVRFMLITLADGIITSICHIGGSWLSSGAMGVVFALLMTYVYRRITHPSYPYGMCGPTHPIMFHTGDLTSPSSSSSVTSVPQLEYNPCTSPSFLTNLNNRRKRPIISEVVSDVH